MADPTQTPIAPVEPSLPSPADLRIEALEAMVRGLGIRMEQMALPQRPSSPRSPLASHDPPPDPLQDTISPLIPIRNRRFQIVLAVDTYRLRDRSSVLHRSQVSSLTSYVNQIRPRLTDCLFTGESPIQVLPFLKQIVRVADQSFLSEAILLWVVDDFLQTPAKESFRAQSFETWPAAVYWLLTTYAPEMALEVAVRRMQTTGQMEQESVRQYGQRFQLRAASLGSLMTQAEVKSLFSQGLHDPVRSLFAANQPSRELDDVTPLSVLVARAELLETGSHRPSAPRPRFHPRTPQYPPSVLVATVEEEYPNRLPDPPVEVLALAAGNRKVSAEKWTCFVCFKVGHGWLECPWLSDVSEAEKEDALVRRRKFMERFRPASSMDRSSSPSPRYPGSRAASPVRMTLDGADKYPIPNLRSQSENGRASPRQ